VPVGVSSIETTLKYWNATGTQAAIVETVFADVPA
jgi:hypothetical protein